jgi:hypothetical protein
LQIVDELIPGIQSNPSLRRDLVDEVAVPGAKLKDAIALQNEPGKVVTP